MGRPRRLGDFVKVDSQRGIIKDVLTEPSGRRFYKVSIKGIDKIFPAKRIRKVKKTKKGLFNKF